jgi:hypothetical protein
VSEAGGKTGGKEEKMGDKKMNSSNRMIQWAAPDFSTEQGFGLTETLLCEAKHPAGLYKQ